MEKHKSNKSKHYDNKLDLIREMKMTQKRSANAVGATWKSYMILGSDILIKEFGFDVEKMKVFIECMNQRIAGYEDGTTNVSQIEKDILDNMGIYYEDPCN